MIFFYGLLYLFGYNLDGYWIHICYKSIVLLFEKNGLYHISVGFIFRPWELYCQKASKKKSMNRSFYCFNYFFFRSMITVTFYFLFRTIIMDWLRNHIALTLSIWVKITFILDQWSPFHNHRSFIIFCGYILFLFGPVIWQRFTTLLFNWIHLLQ